MYRSYRVPRWIARGLRRVERWLLGPSAGGLPERGVHSIVEACWREPLAGHVEDVRVADQATVREYPFPEDYPPWFRRQKAFDRRHTYRLTDVVVSPRSGVVWLPEGHVLEESVGSLNRLMGWGDAWHEAAVEPLEPSDAMEAHPLVVCPASGASYFHWLFEVLPGVLGLVGDTEDARLLMHEPGAYPDYVGQSLGAALGDGAVTSAVRANRPVRVPRLVLRTHLPYSGFVHPRDVELLHRIRDGRSPGPAEGGSAPGSRRLYISRRRAERRPFDAEGRLEEALVSAGFTTVRCEELTFREQVARFRDAEVIVGPHGAGLGNMGWADPPCRVVEIFPTGVFNDCFARLALELGFDYRYVTASRDAARTADDVTSLLRAGV